MGFKRFDNGWRFKVGGVNGEPFEKGKARNPISFS